MQKVGRVCLVMAIVFGVLGTGGLFSRVRATPLRIEAEPSPSNYLVGDESTPSFSLIDAATTMPAVVRAMQAFAARGYVRDYSADAAQATSGAAAVALGYSIPAHPGVGGVILVATQVADGQVRTSVAGMLVERDPVTGLAVASSVMTQGEPAIVVGIADMSKTTQSNYISKQVIGEVGEWLLCVVGGCASQAGNCAALLFPQSVATCQTVACLIAAVGCALVIFR